MSKCLVTVKTKDRFWHFALTMLSLVNNKFDGDIVVFDDCSFDWDRKEKLLVDLQRRKMIKEFYRVEPGLGFCGISSHVLNYFLSSRYNHWLSCDDDLIWEQRELGRAMVDYVLFLKNGGVLNIFVNCWVKYKGLSIGPLKEVNRVGFACFLTDRKTIELVGDVYKDSGTDTEMSITLFCDRLREKSLPPVVRYFQPYLCQHTGNLYSAIWGSTPKWEGAWSRNPSTNTILRLPSYDGIRESLKRNDLESFVRLKNVLFPVKVLLD